METINEHGMEWTTTQLLQYLVVFPDESYDAAMATRLWARKSHYGARTVLLRSACVYGSVRAVSLMVANGPLWHWPVDGDEQSALHYAIAGVRFNAERALAVVQLLVEAGATVDALDRTGTTPLRRACNTPHGEHIAEYLVDRGADPERKEPSAGSSTLYVDDICAVPVRMFTASLEGGGCRTGRIVGLSPRSRGVLDRMRCRVRRPHSLTTLATRRVAELAELKWRAAKDGPPARAVYGWDTPEALPRELRQAVRRMWPRSPAPALRSG